MIPISDNSINHSLYIPPTPVKEAPLDRVSRLATIIFAESFFVVAVGSAIGSAFAIPFSILIFKITAIALTAILLKETIPLLIKFLPATARKIAYFAWSPLNEIAAVFAYLAVYLTGYINNDPVTLPPGTKKITLLVHGFLHNRSAWFYILHRLQQEKVGPVFTLNLGAPRNKIEDYAEIVRQRVAEIKKMAQTDHLEVTIVGHSMGGLVVVDYAANLKPEENVTVKKVITAGAPLHGTPIWWLGGKLGFPSANQMKPGDPLQNELEEKSKIATAKGMQFYHLGFGADIMVPPERTYYDPKRSKIYEHLGHAGSLYSEDVADDLVRIIRDF